MHIVSIITLFLLISFGHATRAEFLDAFKVKSLVQFEGQTEIFEVEEIYDKPRELGKATIRHSSDFRTELHVRTKDKLYSSASLTGESILGGCLLSQTRPTDGLFNYFRDIAKLVAQLKPEGNHEHLIGPAALLYLYRDELMKLDGVTSNEFALSKSRRRLILDSSTGTNYVEGGFKVTFDRVSSSMGPIERAPLLATLAASATLEFMNATKFKVDYLSIDEIDSTQLALSSRDPFKLPAAFVCLKSGVRLKGEMYSLFESWSKKLPIMSNQMSATFFKANRLDTGVRLSADLSRFLFKIDLNGDSEDVFDLKRGLLYHMPSEAPLLADAAEDVLNHGLEAHNSECSILSLEGIFENQAVRASDRMSNVYYTADRWQFLLGRTDQVVYLGKTNLANKLIAHEYELSYPANASLPDFILSIISRGSWHSIGTIEAGQKLINRLWISARSCPHLYSDHDQCKEPSLLGFRLELVEVIGDSSGAPVVKLIDEVTISDFDWSLGYDSDDQVYTGKSSEIFDFSRCPLETISISTAVKWYQEMATGEGSINRYIDHLDDYVAQQLNDYLYTFASSDLMIAKLERIDFAGTRMAKYVAQIAQEPRWTTRFKLKGQTIVEKLAKSLVASNDKATSRYECFTWASQFGNSKALGIQADLGGCHVYAIDDIDQLLVVNRNETGGQINQTSSTNLGLFERIVEHLPNEADEMSGLKVFVYKHIDTIIKQMTLASKRQNEREARLANYIVRDIRLEPAFVEPDLGEPSARHQVSAASLIALKRGYRFIEISRQPSQGQLEQTSEFVRYRNQYEVSTLAQCLARCHREPSCSSAAHCRYPESGHEFCQLTNISLQTLTTVTGLSLDNLLTRDAGCEVHAKDYLHFFDQEDGIQVKSNIYDGLWFKSSGEPIDVHQCAAMCMNQAGETCMKFIHCGTQRNRCLFWIPDGAHELEGLDTIDGSEIENATNLAGCSTFKREPITMYRRTQVIKSAGEWVSATNDGDLRESQIDHMSLSLCAEQCNLDAECQSFDSCLIVTKLSRTRSTGNKKSSVRPQDLGQPRLQCVLLSKSSSDGGMRFESSNSDADTNRESEPTIDIERNCGHYERLSASNRQSDEGAAQVADIIQSGSTGNISIVCHLLGSALVGVVLAIVLKYNAVPQWSSIVHTKRSTWRRAVC